MLFLCTANVTDTIPGPLLDRMELVRLSGYILEQKVQIASRYLEPAARKQMGLLPEHMELTAGAVESLIRRYCREAGVRNLQKHIEKICRKVALKVVRSTQAAQVDSGEADGAGPASSSSSDGGFEAALVAATETFSTPCGAESPGADGASAADEDAPPIETTVVGAEELIDYVGKPLFQSERIYDVNPPGVVNGLAWTSMGGAVLHIETSPCGHTDGAAAESDGGAASGGAGGASVRSTGQMGDVMRESTQIAHTFARQYVRTRDAECSFLDRTPLHVHVPEGATPKDGPSAGITLVTSFLSLALGKTPRSDIAMTGEITLNGRVLAIGGVKEKLMAARRAGITHVLFPTANEADYAELPDDLKEGVSVSFVHHFDDVYRAAFDDGEQQQQAS